MCYKIVACVILILSVHSLVLAAPVPGEEVIIASEKRAAWGNPYERMYSGSDSGSGSGSIGTLPGKTGVPLDPNLNSEFKQASSSTPKNVHWGPIHFHDPDHQPDVNLDSAGPTTENKPASAQSASFDPTTKVHFLTDSLNLPLPPGREGYLAKVAAQQSSSPKIEDVSSPKYLGPPADDGVLTPPPGREGYLAKVAGQQSSSPNIEYMSSPNYFYPPPSPTPKSKGFISNSKKLIGKLGKLNFRPRF
jgi:hypothetical protein